MKKFFFILMLLTFLPLWGQEPALENKEDEELWVFAEGLFERTWYKDAIKEYENFLTKFPDSEKAQSVRWRIYECWTKLNESAKQMQALDSFIKNEKDPVQKEKARMNKARMLFEQDKHDEALKIYETINQKADDSSLWESARYEAARIFLKKGKEGEAFLRFRQLASLDYTGKSSVRAYAIFALATLLSEKNQIAEAVKEYNRLVLIKDTPKEISENAWYNLGVIHFSAGEFEKSQAAFMEVINNFPNGTFHESAVNQTARSFIQQTKHLEAIQMLKQNDKSTGSIALERDYLKAYLHWQLKQYEEAVKLFEVCINSEIDTYREDAGYNKINCLHDLGSSQAVLDEVSTYLKLYPKSKYTADLNYTAGQDAEKLKKYAEAEKYFRMSLKTYVGEWPLVDNAYFALANVLNILKNYAEEGKVWEELYRRERSEFRESALLKGSEAWYKAKDVKKSLSLLNEYLKAFPKGNDLYYVQSRIAEIHIMEGSFKEASDFLEKVLASSELKPVNKASLQSVLGRVYYYQKDYEKAISELQKCLKSKSLTKELTSDCLVYIGFSQIADGREADGVKSLAGAFEDRNDFKSLLNFEEENAIALLLEKYKYIKIAESIYNRLRKAENRKMKISGLMGIARLSINNENPESGLEHLNQVLELCTEEDLVARVGAMSIMGEIYFKTGKVEQALQTFDFALKMKAGDEKSICRSLYGMAVILKNKKDFDKARRYANQVFILYNDQEYSPRAMFLSLQCSLLTSRKKEVTQTAKELKKKFPLYFAKIEVQDYLKEHGINTD